MLVIINFCKPLMSVSHEIVEEAELKSHIVQSHS